ncbi:cysteine-rich RLK (RECEPTOR-like protein kinase) 8 [Abeliophyllum distichum]|uniref:Cysteine-rich RLK (RECEPTOR-like protein kinase) 8 n=1 Tax=Abeliophyllum distichum TaxID=126358 RepID=A0ABD1UQM9_9LAMI
MVSRDVVFHETKFSYASQQTDETNFISLPQSMHLDVETPHLTYHEDQHIAKTDNVSEHPEHSPTSGPVPSSASTECPNGRPVPSFVSTESSDGRPSSPTGRPFEQFSSPSPTSQHEQPYVIPNNQLRRSTRSIQTSTSPKRLLYQLCSAYSSRVSSGQIQYSTPYIKLPSSHYPIGCKWVFKVKFYYDGTFERYKARLVAKGFTQQEGIDYNETFAPVAKLTIVRCLLAIASIRDWTLHQMDVHNAFLHGDLDEEVYITPPPGFRRQGETSLFGFKQSHAYYSLFTKVNGDSFTAISLYVDDMIVTGNDKEAISSTKTFLASQFKLKDLGTLKYFFRVEISRSRSGVSIYQRNYTLDILQDAGLLGAKLAAFPMEQSLKFNSPDGKLLKDPTYYRRLVRKLIYLTITRPEISYSVNTLSQFMQAHRQPHIDIVHRLLQYLKGTAGRGLYFPSSGKLQLAGFCDVDWAGDITTRRSVTGYCIFFGKALIS